MEISNPMLQGLLGKVGQKSDCYSQSVVTTIKAAKFVQENGQ